MPTFSDKSHAENILQQLWAQRETDQYCEVVLIAGAENIKIPAHRSILSVASEYFNRRFAYENQSKEVKINDVSGDTLNSLIEYCYTGRVEIRKGLVPNLLQAVDMLLLKKVSTACGDFLEEQLDPTNCLGFAHFADRCNCKSLLERAKEYCADNFMEVSKTEEFLDLNTEQLGQLLARDDLRVPNEEHIFKSLINWIEHDRIEREKYKDELLKLVRLPLMEPSFLNDRVKSFCTSTASYDLYVKTVERYSLPECRKPNSSELTKPRASYEHLMGITLCKESNKMFIHYYCLQELKWMKWWNALDYRDAFSSAIMEHQLFIIGGVDTGSYILNTVISLNLKTMTLTQVSPMIEHRRCCAAAVLNGFLYVAGGLSEPGQPYSSVERFDPRDNTWNKVSCTKVRHSDLGLVGLNNKLYAIGAFFPDSINESYDPHQNQWTPIASRSKINGFCKVVAANGLIYAVAIAYCYNPKTVERYDPTTNHWTTICSLREKLENADLCTTFQDKVVVCYEDRVDVYNATTNEWKAHPSIKGLANISCMFSYPNQLRKSEFAEN